MSYLQIKDESDNVLDDSLTFSPNELEYNQFWNFYRLPNSEYGYISNQKYIGKSLSVALGNNFKDNGKIILHIWCIEKYILAFIYHMSCGLGEIWTFL